MTWLIKTVCSHKLIVRIFCFSYSLGTGSGIDGYICLVHYLTVMLLGFWTSRSEQTEQTQISLLLEEQSDQGLHCLLFHLHLFDAKVRPLFWNFR